jgi:hypothetical protein
MRTLPAVKIFGERNTGTNYLVRLLQLNAEADLLRGTLPRGLARMKEGVERLSGSNWNVVEAYMDACFALTRPFHLGWKHAAPDPDLLDRYSRRRKLLVVTLTRNPYSWLLALYKRPYHAHSGVSFDSFEKFLSSRWKSVARENGPRYFETPVHLWNYKNASFLDLDARRGLRAAHHTFERLVRDPEEVVRALAGEGGFSLKGGGFQNHQEATKGEEGRDHAYYRDYYGKELWKEKLSREAVGLINRNLDLDVCHRYGYGVLEPDSFRA